MTVRALFSASFAAFAVILLPVALAAQEAAAQDMSVEEMTQAMMHTAGTIEWGPIESEGFDSGMQVAVLSGDPFAEGQYVLRLSFPDGYRFPRHWHPKTENLTVLEGTLLLGMGDEVSEEGMSEYHAGDYLYLPARNVHFGGARGATVIQLHGAGPFEINLAD